MNKSLITGSNGRVYREASDGKLVEVFDATGHAKRQLEASDDKTVTGVRLIDPANPNAAAVVVTLDEIEGHHVAAVIRAILAARAAQ